MGPLQTARDTVLKIHDYLHDHAWTTSLFRREVFRVMDLAEPHKDVTEIQVILHEWDHLLAEGRGKSAWSRRLPEIDAGHRVDHP